MEQDRGDRKPEPRRQSLGERWRDLRLTKTVVFWSCVASMVLTMVVGFAWGGWVTGATAQTMADKIAQDAVIKRLGPICVVQFNKDARKDLKLKELKAADSWKRTDYIEQQGWATMPGEEKPDRDVAADCARLLTLVSQ